MSKIYEIEIEETLQKVVKIEANSIDESIDIAKEKYSNQEYILDYQDYKDTEFREYKDEVMLYFSINFIYDIIFLIILRVEATLYFSINFIYDIMNTSYPNTIAMLYFSINFIYDIITRNTK